jgi:hypothetical protein
LQLLKPSTGRLVIQSPERDIQLLTRLVKIAPPLIDQSISRSIFIKSAQKLCEIAKRVGLFAHHTLHNSTQIYRHRFESVDELFEWMYASTHGRWRRDIVDANVLSRFVVEEFEPIDKFGKTLQAEVFRLVFSAPSSEEMQEFFKERKYAWKGKPESSERRRD